VGQWALEVPDILDWRRSAGADMMVKPPGIVSQDFRGTGGGGGEGECLRGSL